MLKSEQQPIEPNVSENINYRFFAIGIASTIHRWRGPDLRMLAVQTVKTNSGQRQVNAFCLDEEILLYAVVAEPER